MLVLSRKCETEIYIGPDITVKVLNIHKRQVKLGIEAPSGFSVRRGELLPITNRGGPTVAEDSLRSQQPCFAKRHERHS
jgi:carbon storage regulator CsrA